MSKPLKISRIGNDYGLILSGELLQELGMAEGDQLMAVRTPDGVKLVPYDPDFEAVLESNRDYMERHHAALSELARR